MNDMDDPDRPIGDPLDPATKFAKKKAALNETMVQTFGRIGSHLWQLGEGPERLEDNQNDMDEFLLEHTAARRLPLRFCQELHISRAHVLQSLCISLTDELVDTLDDAAEEGTISPEATSEVMLADFIMSGVTRDAKPNSGATTYVVAEVSGSLNHHDITRAKERAAALQAATGCATIPTIAATVIPEPQRAQAKAEGVRVFLLVHQ